MRLVLLALALLASSCRPVAPPAQPAAARQSGAAPGTTLEEAEAWAARVDGVLEKLEKREGPLAEGAASGGWTAWRGQDLAHVRADLSESAFARAQVLCYFEAGAPRYVKRRDLLTVVAEGQPPRPQAILAQALFAADGKLIVGRKIVDGQVAPLDEAGAAPLRDEAVRLLGLASAPGP